ncbi:MAG: ATP-binding protein [Candidatus Thiodiazotropha sp.]
MNLLRNASIKHKLEVIILLITASALFLSLLLFMILEMRTARGEAETRLQSLALLLGANSSAAITFNDRNTASDILATLSTQNDVIEAVIFLENDDIFARYRADNITAVDDLAIDKSTVGSYFSLVAVEEIISLDGETIGSLRIVGDMSRARSLLFHQSLMALGVFIVSMLFAFWLSNRFQRVISQPVQQLLRTMKKVAVKRDFSHRAKRLSNDELGSLVDGFNAMLDRIQKHDSKLAAYHLDLERQVTERTKELNTAKNDAEAASQAKSDFLATMSHEIRTPMSGVIGFGHLLKKTSLNQQQFEYVDIIISSAQGLLEIIDDILNFSKMEAGKFTLEHSNFMIENLTHGVEMLFAPKAREKGLNLTSYVAEDVSPMLYGDPARIRQILINLVGNAIKFTDEGSVRIAIDKIDQRPEHDQHRLRITVSDTGIGITPEQYSQLFQPFQQCDGSITRNYGGTGLGLVIAQRLVYLMDGEITLTSTPGEGSTFVASINVGSPKSISESDNVLAITSSTNEKTKTLDDESQTFINLTILVVDDSNVNLTLAKTLLLKKGATVIAVTSAIEALRVIPDHDFDLILMDLEMPKMSGIEAARKIGEMQNSKHIPIIAVTAHVLPQKHQDVMAAGMKDLLAKPYLPDQLYAIVSKWTGHLYKSQVTKPAFTYESGDLAIYNRQVALASVSNDNEAAQLILDEFLEMLPNCESALREAHLAGDLTALYQAAHKLEGSAGSGGASLIYKAAASLKDTLKQDPVHKDTLEQCVNKLLAQTSQFKQYFQNLAKAE